jgi:hypothetical protein
VSDINSDDDLRGCLVDYIRFAHHQLDQLLDDPSFPDRWHLDELRKLSASADSFSDVLKICARRSTDRQWCHDTGIEL